MNRMFRIFSILTLLVLLTPDVSDQAKELTIASAANASVVTPVEVSIRDHYGDPDEFTNKYIIKKPPVLV